MANDSNQRMKAFAGVACLMVAAALAGCGARTPLDDWERSEPDADIETETPTWLSSITAPSFEYVEGVDVSEDGSLLLVGRSIFEKQAVCFNREGEVRWARSWPTDDGASSSVAAIKGGGFVVAHDAAISSFPNGDATLLSFSADGDLRWQRQLGGEPYLGGIAIHEALNGDLLLVIQATYWDLWGDVVVMRLDNEARLIWQRRIDISPVDHVSEWRSIVETDDGSIYLLLGHYENIRDQEIFSGLFALDSDGRFRWARSIGSGELWPKTLAVSGETILVAGDVVLPGVDQFEGWMAAFDREGALRWSRRLATERFHGFDEALVAPSGDFIVAGSYDEDGDPSSWDIFVASMSPNGEARWTTTFDAPVTSSLAGIGVDAESISMVAHYLDHDDSWPIAVARVNLEGQLLGDCDVSDRPLSEPLEPFEIIVVPMTTDLLSSGLDIGGDDLVLPQPIDTHVLAVCPQ